MKNLSSKLFGGLAAAALVLGSFATSSVQAEPVDVNEITVQDVRAEEIADAGGYFICGSGWCAVVKID